jgi:hypothetical protein
MSFGLEHRGIYELILECVPENSRTSHREIWHKFRDMICNRADIPQWIRGHFGPYLKDPAPPGIFEDYLSHLYHAEILTGDPERPGTRRSPLYETYPSCSPPGESV